MSESQPKHSEPQAGGITFQRFLETVPPGRTVRIAAESVETKWNPGPPKSSYRVLPLPELSLHCGHASCDRLQKFKSGRSEFGIHNKDGFLSYLCKNCELTSKTFAIRVYFHGADQSQLAAFKFGEVPQFGPPLSAKLMQLAGGYIDLLKKGRQAENQSMGIAAFAYYRRVVEEQKVRLIDELQKAIDRLGGNAAAATALDQARTENRFSKALELMAGVTPKELSVSGQNPLRLLHSPLSAGLHGATDEECLSKAHSIRVVLTALLDRIQMVTEEKSELDAAIKDLLTVTSEDGSDIESL